jgi:hypothetical protein
MAIVAKAVKKNKDAYYKIMRKERDTLREKQQKKLLNMDPQQKAKYISSLLKFAAGKSTDEATVATDATMTFEGRVATATTPVEIRKLLAGYTYYVSMDSTDDIRNKEVDKMMEDALTSFNSEGAGKDKFDESHREKINERVKKIEEERGEGVEHANDKILNSKFTRAEFRRALKTLKKKMRKSPGEDGVHNWMLVMAGEEFKEMLLDMYNECWETETIPEEWTRTLVSYIYKNKGAKNELTSYRPIGLTGAIMNLFKRMWLARLVRVLAPQIAPNQGGFRKGSGPKEQLWMLVEFMNDQMESGEDASFCTTDVHKAFDQVYREGTIYLLYAYGVRGTMLRMITSWMMNNIATQRWRGHIGEEMRLDANGLRQGCNLSPILYLVIINTLVAKPPGHHMPEWDEGFVEEAFNQGVQVLTLPTDDMRWLVYLFVDDTAFASSQGHMMNDILAAYANFISKWRIRVNESKCKILENASMKSKMNTYTLKGKEIPKVEGVKYLGSEFGEKGTNTQDKVIEAKSVQHRLTIRTIRTCLGEKMALEYLESYTTPKVLHGAEYTSMSNKSINEMHAWCISEVLGIGRRGAGEGHSGLDVNVVCVWDDYDKPTWSQRRNLEAKRIHRSILRMEDTALPKKLMKTKGMDNVLTRRYTDTLMTFVPTQPQGTISAGRSRLTKEEKMKMSKGNTERIIAETLARNNSEPQRNKWKTMQKNKMRQERRRWVNHMHEELQRKTGAREEMGAEKRTQKLGTGSAWIRSLAPTMGHAARDTHMDSKVPGHLKRNIRRLKAGHMPGLKTLTQMKNPQWGKMDYATRHSLIRCKCGKGEIQDMKHIMTSCNWTEPILRSARRSLAQIKSSDGTLDGTETARGERLVRMLFFEGGLSETATAEKCKILNTLHNRIAKVLKTQKPTLWPADTPDT